MVVRVENNNGGQNVGGPRSGENQGSALGQLRNTFVSYSVEEQVIRAELCWVRKLVESDFSFNPICGCDTALPSYIAFHSVCEYYPR